MVTVHWLRICIYLLVCKNDTAGSSVSGMSMACEMLKRMWAGMSGNVGNEC